MTFQSPTNTNSAPSCSAGINNTPVYNARDLTGDENTALIVLDDKTYTLRETRAGKLILTK